jgi:2-polyprenyl-3-methyl-5-hydroxy-6-metoxy-1,4-benzoquinol methylase
MSVGSAVRRRLGRFEEPVTNAYRARFVSLPAFVSLVRRLGSAERILEVGCGEGALCTELAPVYPSAELLGIDIAPEPGRLFRGDRQRVIFRSLPTAALVAEHPQPFDLVVLCDVLHHVPPPERDELLRDARRLTAPGGLLVVKDWERQANLAHMLNYLSDRYLTGDRVVYLSSVELRAQLRRLFPGDRLVLETRVPPRPNNMTFALRALS